MIGSGISNPTDRLAHDGEDGVAKVTTTELGTIEVLGDIVVEGGGSFSTTLTAQDMTVFGNFNSSGVARQTGGLDVPGRYRYSTIPIGGVAYSQTGNDSTPVDGTTYLSDIIIPRNMTVTGVAVFNGSVAAGANKSIVSLYNHQGEKLANSSLSGVAMTGTNSFQEVPFITPTAVIGPGHYWVGVQFNGTTNRFRSVTNLRHIDVLAHTEAGVFATVPASFSPPITFTADVGPIVYIYETLVLPPVPLTFNILNRAPNLSWVDLEPLSIAGDFFWGNLTGTAAVDIPQAKRALSIKGYSGLSGLVDADLQSTYRAIELDGEWRNPEAATALLETQQIRAYIDAYNARNPSETLEFHAYYNLHMYTLQGPALIPYADVSVFGNSSWQSGGTQLSGDPEGNVNILNLQTEAAPYLAMIAAASGTPSILCGFAGRYRDTVNGGSIKVHRTAAEVEANIRAVITDLGCSYHSYYYDSYYSDTLETALRAVGR